MFKNVILIEMSKCTRLSANLSSWSLYLIDLNIGTQMLMLIIGNTFLKDINNQNKIKKNLNKIVTISL